jgi:Domain of unknown function (DUF4345)
MQLAKFSIFISILIYLIIGLWCLAAPIQTSSGIDIQLPTPTAIIDFRATYGGLLVGIGIFFIVCLKEAYLKIGLILQALSLGGLAFGRIVGIILDGMPRPLLIYFLVAEIAAVILAMFAFQRLTRNRRPYLTS